MLGGIDDKPAEIKANGGKPPVIFNYADYGVYQPGYAIVATRRWSKNNPDLVPRFVKATLEAVKAAKANPDDVDPVADQLVGAASRTREGAGARGARRHAVDPESPNNKDKQLGLNVAADWDSALDMLKKYKELKTDQPARRSTPTSSCQASRAS